MAMSALIKSLEDIMRKDAGLNGDAQYIEQITWLLFLKAFDAKEMEWEFKPEYKGVIPHGYRWRDWATDKEGITGDFLIDFIGTLFRKLRDMDAQNDVRKYVVKNVFADINNYMKSGIYLRQLINRINEKVDFIDAIQKHTFNDLYEGMLKDLQSAGRAGEFYTPRPVTNFIVEKVNPKLGEIVLDPACGTGGFLTSTINHIGEINTTEQLAAMQASINGWEKKPLPYLLAMTNLILHDMEVPQIIHQNSLNKPVTDYTEKDRVDVIVANPPFGGAEDNAVKQNFPAEFKTSETADLFMVLIMYLLKDKGRAGVVLPDGFMFGDGVKINIKKKLLEEYGLHTVIRLPQVFKPYASVNTNLFFFQKGVRSSGVWFYRLDLPEGVKSFSKTKPMQDYHFDPVRAWWDDRKALEVDGFDKARFYTVKELVALNYNFDKCCPFPNIEEEILEPAEVIARYQTERARLNASLDSVISCLTSKLNGLQTDIVQTKGEIISRLLKLNSEFPDKLRKSILKLAVQGKLTSQNNDDHSVLDLIKCMQERKRYLIDNGIIKIDQRHTAYPIADDDVPFEIPNTWRWMRLADIVSFSSGKTPPRHDVTSWTPAEFPWVSISDMVDGGVVELTTEKISQQAFKKYFSDMFIPKGTIIMSFKLTIGKISYLGMDAVHNEAIINIFPYATGETEQTLNEYLFKVLPWIANSGDLKNAVKGKTLNATSISNLLVPLPPLEEQRRIVARVEELAAICKQLKA